MMISESIVDFCVRPFRSDYELRVDEIALPFDQNVGRLTRRSSLSESCRRVMA